MTKPTSRKSHSSFSNLVATLVAKLSPLQLAAVSGVYAGYLLKRTKQSTISEHLLHIETARSVRRLKSAVILTSQISRHGVGSRYERERFQRSTTSHQCNTATNGCASAYDCTYACGYRETQRSIAFKSYKMALGSSQSGSSGDCTGPGT